MICHIYSLFVFVGSSYSLKSNDHVEKRPYSQLVFTTNTVNSTLIWSLVQSLCSFLIHRVLNFFLFFCVPSPEQARLCELEDQAKASKKGQWSEGGGTHTIRDMKYTIENPRNFVDSLHQKPINGNELARGMQASTLSHSYRESFGQGNKDTWHVKTHNTTFKPPFPHKSHILRLSEIIHPGWRYPLQAM